MILGEELQVVLAATVAEQRWGHHEIRREPALTTSLGGSRISMPKVLMHAVDEWSREWNSETVPS